MGREKGCSRSSVFAVFVWERTAERESCGRVATKLGEESVTGRQSMLHGELTKEHRMQSVDVGNKDGRCQHQQQKVSDQEVRTP